jgi:hypothetical protein
MAFATARRRTTTAVEAVERAGTGWLVWWLRTATAVSVLMVYVPLRVVMTALATARRQISTVVEPAIRVRTGSCAVSTVTARASAA